MTKKDNTKQKQFNQIIDRFTNPVFTQQKTVKNNIKMEEKKSKLRFLVKKKLKKKADRRL